MTETDKALAIWNAKTEAEQVEWIAVMIMKWRKDGSMWRGEGTAFKVWKTTEIDRGEFIHPWHPLTNWNDWRQVEEKITEDDDLFTKVLHHFVPNFPEDKKDEAGAWQYIYAILPERCTALYLAFNSLPPTL